jgi:superfamily I DNA/RNA helicase
MGEHIDYEARVSINSFVDVAKELFTLATGLGPHLADQKLVRSTIVSAAADLGVTEFSEQFLISEWEHVVDAWQLSDLEAYAKVPRMGRKNRLGVRQREALWPVFEEVRRKLNGRSLYTENSLFADVKKRYADKSHKPFDHIVVDEAQDLGVSELKFLSSISDEKQDALYFAGDIGQRIFQQPFSWKELGVDVRGRSSTLRVNYRTSHQIRKMADQLLPDVIRDVDGLEDDRRGTVSLFDGVSPDLHIASSVEEECSIGVEHLKKLLSDGYSANEIGIFYRSREQSERARAIANGAGLSIKSNIRDVKNDETLVGLMHLAKGLEFRAVLVVCCDENILPLEARIADVADEFELDEVIATEKQLLYVACTRARESLFVSGVSPGSEFLDDLKF